jgi:hypothetical protein
MPIRTPAWAEATGRLSMTKAATKSFRNMEWSPLEQVFSAPGPLKTHKVYRLGDQDGFMFCASTVALPIFSQAIPVEAALLR